MIVRIDEVLKSTHTIVSVGFFRVFGGLRRAWFWK